MCRAKYWMFSFSKLGCSCLYFFKVTDGAAHSAASSTALKMLLFLPKSVSGRLVSILKNDGLIFRLSNTGQDTPVLGYRNTYDHRLDQEKRWQRKGTEDGRDKVRKGYHL
jgi:hypothetical protein